MVFDLLKKLFSNLKPKTDERSKPNYRIPANDKLLKKTVKDVQLAEPNIFDGWQETDDWRDWEAPLNLIRGESHYQKDLVKLIGKPRINGYLIPINVDFFREPENKYDSNAIRAELMGTKVGYIAKEVATKIGPIMDSVGIKKFTLAGVVRGGSKTARNFGIHVWVNRRITLAPFIGSLEIYETAWPPDKREGRPTVPEMDAYLPRKQNSKPGDYNGYHYTDYVDEVHRLKHFNNLDAVEKLLIALIDAVESEDAVNKTGVAPWYYEQLAIVYRKRKKIQEEIAILEQFARQRHAPGALTSKLLNRLKKLHVKLQEPMSKDN